jgi:5-methylcytosine-specific restriction enzyme subunit McrC
MRIELLEYGSSEVELSPEDALELSQIAGNTLSITLGSQPGWYRVTATSHVGNVVTPAVTVQIRPKVATEHLFLMLGVSPPTEFGARTGYGDAADLLPIMAAVFARAVEQATAKGVYRGYRPTEERLISPRGRIDVTAQIRRPAMISPIACRFDEYTADVLCNRVLVAALERLHRVPGLEPHLRVRLNRLAGRFEDVARVEIDPALIDRWKPTRQDAHYEESMRLAAVVLRHLTLAQRAGRHSSPSFTVNMNDLFQDFIAQRLRRHLRGRLAVVCEPPTPLARSGNLKMLPDLVFRRGDANVYVGDAKYKLSTGPGRLTDYYQLLAYATAMGLSEGVLIYAQDPGDTADPLGDDLVHSSQIRNTETTLHVYRVPMSGTAADLERSVQRLAEWIAQRARPNGMEAAA